MRSEFPPARKLHGRADVRRGREPDEQPFDSAEVALIRDRLVIRGGSAGGFTTLCALAFREVFAAGASLYGIGDLEALATDTHKFEARYLDSLVGPYPERRDLYVERSPLHAADRLSCPVIFFQGLEDKVVPPNQAETMVEALRRKGIPVAYVPFAGEQHGFRRAENIRRSLECELYFYSRVFGFTLPDPPPPLQIENLDFNGLIPGLVSKKFDMVSVGLTATPERKKAISFSRPYVPYAQVLAVRPDDTTPATIAAWNSSDKTITSLQGSTAEQRVQNQFPNATSKSFPDQNAAFLEVATGRADAIVVENYLVAQFNKSNPNNKLKEAPFKRPLTVEYGSWAVQKGNTALARYLSAFICKAQNNGTLARFYQKTEGTKLPPMPACK